MRTRFFCDLYDQPIFRNGLTYVNQIMARMPELSTRVGLSSKFPAKLNIYTFELVKISNSSTTGKRNSRIAQHKNFAIP